MSLLKTALMRVADNRRPDSLAVRLRLKRVDQFTALVSQLPRPVTILDVGGTTDFWRIAGLIDRPELAITTLNLNQAPNADRTCVQCMVGDARNMRHIADRAFDVVFSNSVIEHVGTLDDQRNMAAEVQRVGKRFFLQTPNRYFPIEPHFLFPFWQFLPGSVRIFLVGRFNIGWYKKTTDKARARAGVTEIRLLTMRELKALFPDARITRERFFGLTKSFLVSGGW